MAKTHTDLAMVPAAIVGGVAGDHTVTGIVVGDRIVAVFRFTTVTSNFQTIVDITSEFTVTAADTINNVGGTDTTADYLMIFYYPIGAGVDYGANAGKDY